MQLSYILALASAVAVVAAAPQAAGPAAPACSSGTAQCCSTTHDEQNAKDILALLGIDQLAGMIGLDCQQIPINAVGGSVAVQNQCKTTPTCCTGAEFNGLLQVGCTPLNIN